MQTTDDLIRGFELERAKTDYAEEHKEQLDTAKFEQGQKALAKETRADPSALDAMSAGFANAPIVRQAQNLYNTWEMERDPDFDPIPHSQDAVKEFGSDVALRLADANSKEEFDYYVEEFREQKRNQELASKTFMGKASTFLASTASMENLLFTVGTAGVGYMGVVAQSARQGMMSNSFRTGVTGTATSYVGSQYDADQMIQFSEEDIGWAMLLGGAGGAIYGGVAGRILKPKEKSYQEARLNSLGGGFMESSKAVYDRAIGKGFEEYVSTHKKKAQAKAQLLNDIDQKRTAIQREDIDDFDFSGIDGEDFDIKKEVQDWNSRNAIDVREANRKKAEEVFDSVEVLQSEYAKGRLSKSSTARMLNYLVHESGTSSVVKNSTASIMMERMQQVYSNMYTPEVRSHFHSYWKRKNGSPATDGFVSKVRHASGAMGNWFETRRQFNEEMILFANSKRNGYKMADVSPEVVSLMGKIDEANLHIYNKSVESGVGGFDQIKYKSGFIHQRHERDYYIKAKNDFGTPVIEGVIRKALMSNRGAGITDVKKAKRIATAFVQRFTDRPTDIRAGSVMDDEAWEVMQDIFEKEGIDFDGKDVKAIFNEGTSRKANDAGRARYAKDRIPLDLTAEHNGLRMLDLLNTDVENLTASYAMSMSGHIALAQKGIKDRNTWNKIKKAVLAEDPEMEEWMDDMYNTFSTGRVGGGITDRRVGMATKLAVVSYLNNLGLTQLTESGTAIATYGINSFMAEGNNALKGMFTGKKSVASTRLAEEISDHFFPLGKEHIAMPPHLNQELQSNSRLATTSMLDKADAGINMGLTAQGYTSLFNNARSWQHHVAYGGLVHKISRYIDEGKGLDEQLASLGFSERLFDEVKDNMKRNGKLDNAGKRDLIGFDQWDVDTRDAFINVIVRNQNQIVQKALTGEGSAWMSKDLGSLLTQFRKFPLESIRKQLIRKHTIGNEFLMQSAMMNLAIAGTIITARNYITGGNTQADMSDVLRSGISYNADFGSVASLWDLGISLTGAPQSMYINPYAIYGEGLFSAPALSAMNNAIKLPARTVEYLGGGAESDDLRVIRATPIIGNHILLSRMFQRPD